MADPDRAVAAGGARLAAERSAYLRAAAGQAIDWHPWGSEPFELARRSGRPILLDIGAAWCHWCHVMDETTYADPEVARRINVAFVAIKVDRDEHPEVDRRFQRQVGALTGEGGWPLTAFLTPDGAVFLGGTFFPPTDGHGRPGFRRVLAEVARLYTEEPDRIAETTRQLKDGLARMRGARARPARATDGFVAEVAADLAGRFDPVHPGFGDAPKFPHPTAIELWFLGDARAVASARATLRAMGEGGVYDQIGGGFHRYSVDAGWHVPHFEKMAVDNAALLGAYLDGLRRCDDPRFAEVARGIVGWIREVLAQPDGGWGASQDADNAPGDDGGYFTWTKEELRGVLTPDELTLAVRAFGVGTDGQMPHDPDRHVLYRLVPPADAAGRLRFPDGAEAAFERIVRTLKAARDRRPTPAVDPARYADLNGRLIGGLARAASILGDPTVLADARRAADGWLAHAFRPELGIAHRWAGDDARGFGLLDDQVAFAAGLIELAGAAAERRYADAAVALLSRVDSDYRGEGGLLRDVAPGLYDGPPIGGVDEPSYPIEDTPHLSANAGAALAFLRLGSLLHDERWIATGRGLLAPLAARLSGAGLFGAGTALAIELYGVPPATVVIEGSGPAAEVLRRAAHAAWHPNVFVFDVPPPPPFGSGLDLPGGSGDGPRALVCFGTRCAPPVTDPAALRPLLAHGAAPVPE